MTGQLLVLKEAADDIAERINKGYLPWLLVWQTLQTMMYPSISYPFGSHNVLRGWVSQDYERGCCWKGDANL
jgi:hypothetical protein